MFSLHRAGSVLRNIYEYVFSLRRTTTALALAINTKDGGDTDINVKAGDHRPMDVHRQLLVL